MSHIKHQSLQNEECTYNYIHNFLHILQTGDNFILKERIFMEPNLVIVRDTSNEECTQGCIVAKQEVIFEVDGFTHY